MPKATAAKALQDEIAVINCWRAAAMDTLEAHQCSFDAIRDRLMEHASSIAALQGRVHDLEKNAGSHVLGQKAAQLEVMLESASRKLAEWDDAKPQIDALYDRIGILEGDTNRRRPTVAITISDSVPDE